MSTDPNRLERRGAQRFQLHLPLTVNFDGVTAPGFSQDLSGRGIFFYTEIELPEGAVVELTFTMPSEITLVENMPVRCRGRVLRASASQAGNGQPSHSSSGHSQPGQRNGIAVRFDSYQYLPSSAPLTQFVRVSAARVGVADAGPVGR